MAATKVVHLLRLGVHSEQAYFTQQPKPYDIIVLNANVAAYSSKGTASFFATQVDEPVYIIDPCTHAFAHAPKYIMSHGRKGEPEHVKKSLLAVAECYGPPASSQVGSRALTPDDFRSERSIRRFTKQVLDFQRNCLRDALSEDAKYLDDKDQIPSPVFLVAPYFYMTPGTIEKWLPVNLAFVEAARELSVGEKMFAEIVIDRGVLEDIEAVEQICSRYTQEVSCDGVLLWLSAFSEHDASVGQLKGMAKCVRQLATKGLPVYNLYGGYFSLLLHQLGMAGVCHGPGYGEERDVIPVGGGMPVAKFYLTPVHQRLLHRDVELMIKAGAWHRIEEFYEEVCDGATCREVLQDSLENFRKYGTVETKRSTTGSGRLIDVLTQETRSNMVSHFLEAKAREFDLVVTKDSQYLVEDLERASAKYENLVSGLVIRHLGNWSKALRQLGVA